MSLLIYYSQVLMNTRMFTLLWINKYRMYNNIIPQIFHFIWIFLICFHNCSFGDRRKRERENWKYVRTCVLRALVVTNTEKTFRTDRDRIHQTISALWNFLNLAKPLSTRKTKFTRIVLILTRSITRVYQIIGKLSSLNRHHVSILKYNYG